MHCLIDHQKEVSDGCYGALKKQRPGAADGDAETSAGDPPPASQGPIYRSKQADGRAVYSDSMRLNSTVQKQVPMNREISAVPPQ